MKTKKPRPAPKPKPPPDPALAERIGSRARACREAAKLTQADVAERVGLQVEVYGRLERGKMLPSVPTLTRLGYVLGVSHDVLLGLAEERQGSAAGSIDDGLSPELRRLLRSIRKLDREQLRLFVMLTNALQKSGKKGAQERKDEDEHATQLGI